MTLRRQILRSRYIEAEVGYADRMTSLVVNMTIWRAWERNLHHDRIRVRLVERIAATLKALRS